MKKKNQNSKHQPQKVRGYAHNTLYYLYLPNSGFHHYQFHRLNKLHTTHICNYIQSQTEKLATSAAEGKIFYCIYNINASNLIHYLALDKGTAKQVTFIIIH